MKAVKRDKISTGGMRWTARAILLGISALFLLFLIDSGLQIIPQLSWTDLRGMPMLFGLIVAVAGPRVSWRWEVAGGTMALLGSAAILVLLYLAVGTPALVAGFTLTLPVIIAGSQQYLACGLKAKSPAEARQSKMPGLSQESSAAAA